MYLLHVVQTQRKHIVIELGRNHTRNRCGVIRTQHEQTAVAVGQLVHLFLSDGRACLREYIIVFQRRRDDFIIAACFKQISDSLLVLSEHAGCREQTVAGALRRGDCILIHTL